ncbi:ribonuclease T2 family protein [Medicago truncatula]|uniref:Ribonuclease T2 family protein n=1 Tax=Medicago truncatula TaxID=3880 RepID=A0A072U1Z1_MEDTR|nr:ribonuclease T2 family protein [Medicago truncatula]
MVHQLIISKGLEEKLKVEWPSQIGRDDDLWQHEWLDHGCFEDFTCEQYFKKRVHIFKLCRVQEALAKDGILPSGKETNTKHVKKALKTENSNLANTELICNKKTSDRSYILF